MREAGDPRLHTVPELPWKAKPVPPCRNHPDRLGIAHYGKSYEYSLCAECLENRLGALRLLELDLDGRRVTDLAR